MTTLALPRAALRALLVRATVVWVLLRLLLAALALSSGEATGNPIGVVVLCTLLGLIDIRRRGEGALWGNLGISTTQVASLFGLVAAAGELLVKSADLQKLILFVSRG